MTRLLKTQIPFMKYRWILLALSALLVLAAIVLIATRPANYGTDFKGGIKLLYQFENQTDEAQITEALKQNSLSSFVVQRLGDAAQNTFVIKGDKPEGLEEKFSQPFNQAFEKSYGVGKFKNLKEEFVGPKVGKELQRNAVYAMFWAWIVMLVYIGFRFDFHFAPGAIVALVHDVLIALGLFVLLGREINLTVVAAFLTIVGYSINDTIIVFDRIREDLQRHKNLELTQLVDKSINETLSRTLITSLTVFFVVVVLFLRAEGEIQNFAFAMMIGVITGTYSSISIASPIFIFLKQHGHRLGLGKKAALSNARR